MSDSSPRLILTLNVGSSSLKFAIYRFSPTQELVLSGNIDRVGLPDGRFRVHQADSTIIENSCLDIADLDSAMRYMLRWLEEKWQGELFSAIGHRVVHGGVHFSKPTPITPEILNKLRSLAPLAPNHLSASISVIEAARISFPNIPHIACFDTSFHRSMPAYARRYGLPRELYELGIQRFGFHGLSYQYIVEELSRLDSNTLQQRVVIAHLGSGASICAVVNGQSVDTTMGLTPLSGMIMGTRSGDVDPELPLYLAAEKGLSHDEIRNLLYKKSGLLGMSCLSADVRDLLQVEKEHSYAAEALEVFCYSAKKAIAAMVAAANGIDQLVFTGGIGTFSPVIRERICKGLQFLEVELDLPRNALNEPVISNQYSKITVRVMATNEELMVARQTFEALTEL